MEKNQSASAGDTEKQVPSLGQEDSVEEERATHSYILPGKSYGQKTLVSYSPWGHKELEATKH